MLKITCILLFFIVFFEALYAQTQKLQVMSSSKYYKIINGEHKIFKLKLINNSNCNIEILDVFKNQTDSKSVAIKTYAKVFYKKNGKYKDFGCNFDSYPLGGFNSKEIYQKKTYLITQISPDCISLRGLYKIRFYVPYRAKGATSSQQIWSNWFWLKVD